MRVRYYIDPETELPHLYGHNVSEQEIEEVLHHPGEDRPGREGSRVAIGQTSGGRFLRRIRARPGAKQRVRHCRLRVEGQTTDRLSTPAPENPQMRKSRYPQGWDDARVKRVLAHYESQPEEEALAEDEAAFEATGQTVMEIPTGLVSKVRQLIAKHEMAQERRATG